MKKKAPKKKKAAKKVVKDTLSFDAFFYKAVKSGKIKIHKKEEIKAFFTKKGLKQEESPEVFESTLKQY